jgi:uncharacterized protein with GYD domain
MPTYVTLVKWTQEGIQNIKGLPDRFQAAGKLIEAHGGKITGAYITMGEYDMVVVSEGPTDEDASACSLAIAAGGHVRTTTMRAFTAPEFAGILKKLP